MSSGNEAIRMEDECVVDQDESCHCPGCLTSFTDKTIDAFLEQYASNGHEAIQVNFRELVSWVPYSDSYTHYIHKYPAKLLKHIPIFFFASKKLLPNKASVILDPFCGSGTVLLEAMLAGHHSIGFDANPLARLISQVKTTSINPMKLYPVVDDVIRKAKRYRKADPKNVVNIDHWFPAHVQYNLSKLKRSIDTIHEQEVRYFFQTCYSAILKSSSYADPNLSVPVKIKPEKFKTTALREDAEKKLEKVKSLDVFTYFEEVSYANIKRMDQLYSKKVSPSAKIWGNDARNLISENGERLADNSVDCILTSPPYAGAQKYIRASSLNLGWLGYCEDKNLRYYEERNIGREHYHKNEYTEQIKTGFSHIDEKLSWVRSINPLRSHINGNYLVEMQQSISEMYRVLKQDSYCVIIIANNHVCGELFETQAFVKDIAIQTGFKHELSLVDDITSRGLMTKRNKTANVINSEWILILKK